VSKAKAAYGDSLSHAHFVQGIEIFVGTNTPAYFGAAKVTEKKVLNYRLLWPMS
jgi:hypothetical protein